MRDRIRRLMQYFFPTRPADARAMRPVDRNRRRPTLDELESRLAPSVTHSGTSADFHVNIDAADNISVGVTDNAKLRVTVEGQGDLDIQQAASSIQKLTITAAGNFGKYTLYSEEEAVFTGQNTLHVVCKFFTLTAANGDMLIGSYDTTGYVDFDTFIGVFVGTYKITGGTGQFANATGSGTLIGVGNLQAPFEIVGAFSGTLSLPDE